MTDATPERLPLQGRTIALGVTGSISAYKAADLTSKLRQAGAEVEVIMTPAAAKFIAPLTFQSLTGREVVVDMFAATEAEAHVEVARRAEALVIAPATADIIAKLANGQADDMVSLTALATNAPILVAPAMDSQMWEHPATQANADTLRNRGVSIVGPETGRLATGREGAGRLAEPRDIVGALRALLGMRGGDLGGRHVVVTAGGTFEPLDPVRYVGNRSSGKMGFSIAEAARDRGARVTLVTGPVALPTPYGVERINIQTALQLQQQLEVIATDADALVMAAAPADFRPDNPADQKIKKQPGDDGLTIHLERNPDIIGSLQGGGIRVGFAAETHDFDRSAREKLKKKRLDFNVLNDVTAKGSGFGTDTNQVTIYDAEGTADRLPLMSKYAVAHAILDRILTKLT